jgi:ABC-type polysaccharide/polyol phosphate transport system ATPase subunit
MNVIEADRLTKAYKLYDRPSARLKELFFKRNFHRDFTALENVSFVVTKGETLGIIGENGAGKSTLLRILSNTLSPTSGRYTVDGIVSSLLELGSGFHPEFTGRENIYFYGSLRGISESFMREKEDEIIAFSELGDFINYPLKTYSSGMFVRLAFSVATAVDPDVLIIDEVLSVGDLHFQKKSTDRILNFKERGKTIVFCSHELYHIARLCDRVIWLKGGKVQSNGDSLNVIQEYETYQLSKNGDAYTFASEDEPSEHSETRAEPEQQDPGIPADDKPKLIAIKKVHTLPSRNIVSGNDLKVRVEVVANDSGIPYRVAVKIRTVDGLDLMGVGTTHIEPLHGNRTVTLLLPKFQLRAGSFIIEAFAFDEEGVYWYDRKEALPVTIPRETIEIGIVDLPHEWIVD